MGKRRRVGGMGSLMISSVVPSRSFAISVCYRAHGFDAPKTPTSCSYPRPDRINCAVQPDGWTRPPWPRHRRDRETCKVIDSKEDNIAGFSDQESLYEYFEDYFHCPRCEGM